VAVLAQVSKLKFLFTLLISDETVIDDLKSYIECKVALGYDLVGNAYTGAADSIPVPDPDPLDACGAASGAEGHGTHVSGIVAAQDHKYVS
jgi:subtilisin family serine protease